jgi:hypothetical protein
MVVLCGNCEEQDATEVCDQCEGEDSFFCQQCWSIHIQVKVFRRHKSHPITTNNGNDIGGLVDGQDSLPQLNDESSLSSSQLNLQKLKLEKGKIKRSERSGEELSAKRTVISAPKLNPKKGYMEGVKDAFLNISDKRPNYEEEFKAMLSTATTPGDDPCTISTGGAEDYSNSNCNQSDQLDQDSPISFLEYCDNLIEACSDVSDIGDMSTKTILYGFFSALLVHIVTKLLFGKSDTIELSPSDIHILHIRV